MPGDHRCHHGESQHELDQALNPSGQIGKTGGSHRYRDRFVVAETDKIGSLTNVKGQLLQAAKP